MTKHHCTSYLNVDQEKSSSVDLLDHLRFASRNMTQSRCTKFCVISGGQSDKFSTIIYLCNEQYATKQFRKQTRDSVFKIIKNSGQIAIKSSLKFIFCDNTQSYTKHTGMILGNLFSPPTPTPKK